MGLAVAPAVRIDSLMEIAFNKHPTIHYTVYVRTYILSRNNIPIYSMQYDSIHMLLVLCVSYWLLLEK